MLAAVGRLVESDATGAAVAAAAASPPPATAGLHRPPRRSPADCSARSRGSPRSPAATRRSSCFHVVPPSVDLKMPPPRAAKPRRSPRIPAAAATSPRRRCSDRSDRSARRCRSCTRPCTAPSGTSCRRRSSGTRRARHSGRTDAPAPRRITGSDSSDRRRSSRSSACRTGRGASTSSRHRSTCTSPSPTARSGRMMPAPVPT